MCTRHSRKTAPAPARPGPRAAGQVDEARSGLVEDVLNRVDLGCSIQGGVSFYNDLKVQIIYT